MTQQIMIKIAVGLALVALGALLAFTQQGDTLRLAGAALAALGLVFTRRALRDVKWRRDKTDGKPDR
jgi:drug/metabolite transporter (DMT)-like permease